MYVQLGVEIVTEFLIFADFDPKISVFGSIFSFSISDYPIFFGTEFELYIIYLEILIFDLIQYPKIIPNFLIYSEILLIK